MIESIPAYLPVIAFIVIGAVLIGAGFRLNPHPFADETPSRTRYGSIALQAGGAVLIGAALLVPGLAAAIFALPARAFGL